MEKIIIPKIREYLQGLTDGGRAELNKETLEVFEEAERIK